MNIPLRQWILLLGIVCGMAGPLAADSISYDDVVQHDVHVTESGALYYVRLPDSGRVVTVQKSRVQEVSLSAETERAALKSRWEASRRARNSTVEFDPESHLNPQREASAPDPIPVELSVPAPLADSAALPRYPWNADSPQDSSFPGVTAVPEVSAPAAQGGPAPVMAGARSEMERDVERGIVERVVEERPDGSKAITLRGSDTPDPAVQQAQVRLLAERDAAAAEAARVAAEEARARAQQMALQQQQLAMQQQYLLQQQAQRGYGPTRFGGFTIVPEDPYPFYGPGYYAPPIPYYYPSRPWRQVPTRPDTDGRPGSGGESGGTDSGAGNGNADPRERP